MRRLDRNASALTILSRAHTHAREKAISMEFYRPRETNKKKTQITDGKKSGKHRAKRAKESNKERNGATTTTTTTTTSTKNGNEMV